MGDPRRHRSPGRPLSGKLPALLSIKA